MSSSTSEILNNELKVLEGLIRQNPETGAMSNTSFINQYTNRIFGSPFQLMDSVDKRISGVNDYLGNKYLKHFILNSPILYIKPGMPQYTGGDKSTGSKLVDLIKGMYWSSHTDSGLSSVESLLGELAKNTIFSQGSKLQKRMFGFRETYYDYMQHVNYMCRSVAIFLGLTETDEYPTGTFTSNKNGNTMESFETCKWENYRMLKSSKVLDPFDYLMSMVGGAGSEIGSSLINIVKGGVSASTRFASILGNFTNGNDVGNDLGTTFLGSITQQAKDILSKHKLSNTITDKISTVQFMVEPVTFTERLTNETKESVIAQAVKGVGEGIGEEIGFITNSNADTGFIGNVMGFLGDAAETVSTKVSQLVEGATGGFVTNLFTGAISAIKGQKMIYPKIYAGSRSGMNYEYSVILSTPYGDIYNYYMNIIVPLLHLIALASPRLVTANTTTSPYLVQAWIPGQCTCHLGIISDMTISKNPNQKRVSVNGFPLEVKVTFTIEELYNAMTISPANDPASFLFNETLNDYLSNLAGLLPSIDTYTKQRGAMFEQLENYLTSGEWLNDAVSGIVETTENFINPFAGR